VVRAREELADARKPRPKEDAVAANPLDGLDPDRIPAAERFPWQPKELVAVIGEHRGRNWGYVSQLAWSADGQFVGSSGRWGGSEVTLWDPRTLRPRVSLPSAEGRFAIAPDSKTLAVVAGNRNVPGDWSVQLWDVSGPKPNERAVIRLPDDAALSVAFSPDGK